jgi:protein-L-isoaspartate(D-aspartate) O-methyltransferase
MLESLEIKKGMKILEIGTGSGYNCALLSELAGAKGKVISIDAVPELVDLARKNMKNADIKMDNIALLCGDGSCGIEKEAPFDRIVVTAAMPQFNKDHLLANQLKEDGKLIAPVGSSFGQDLILFENKTKSMQAILPVIFVPLVGKCGFKKGLPQSK